MPFSALSMIGLAALAGNIATSPNLLMDFIRHADTGKDKVGTLIDAGAIRFKSILPIAVAAQIHAIYRVFRTQPMGSEPGRPHSRAADLAEWCARACGQCAIITWRTAV